MARGTWSWSGPQGFSATSHEISFDNIQPAQAGIYKVTYTNASGCQSSAQTFTLNVSSEIVTGMHHEEPQPFQIYPNPTASSILISNAMKLNSVTIHDIHGRQLGNAHNEVGSANIFFEDLPAGIYLIELVDSRGTPTIRRVVKK